jgi:hypothetical protein
MLGKLDLNLDEKVIAEKIKKALPYMNAIQKSYFLGASEMIIVANEPDPDEPAPEDTEKKPA